MSAAPYEPQSVSSPNVQRGRLASTMGYYASLLSLGLAVAVLGPTLPDLAQRTHTDMRKISILFTTLALGYMLGALQGGVGMTVCPAIQFWRAEFWR